MKQAQGITEQLKAENALEWVDRMNNIQACARECGERSHLSIGGVTRRRASLKMACFSLYNKFG